MGVSPVELLPHATSVSASAPAKPMVIDNFVRTAYLPL